MLWSGYDSILRESWSRYLSVTLHAGHPRLLSDGLCVQPALRFYHTCLWFDLPRTHEEHETVHIRTDSVTFKTGYDYTQRLRTSRSLSPPPPNLFPTRNPDRRRLHRVPPHRASHRTSARPGPQAVSRVGGSCLPPPYRYYPPSCMRVQMEIGDGLSFGRPVRGNDREVEAF